VRIGLDNNANDDIDDAGDDVLVSDSFASNVISLSYDDNGNLTDDGVFKFTYNAWNQMRYAQLAAESDTTAIAQYEWDGRGRRVRKTVNNCGIEETPNDGGDTTLNYYYDRGWSILEERNGLNQALRQYLWGTRYTDELIWIDVNGNPAESNDCDPDDQTGESTADARRFAHQDRNWNLIAFTDYGESVNGEIIERYRYTPYGRFVVLDGETNGNEMGNVLPTSSIGNVFTHQGLPYDAEKRSFQNRRREFLPELQRFAQRDPIGYAGGINLYAYVSDRPTAGLDPSGLVEFCRSGNCAGGYYGQGNTQGYVGGGGGPGPGGQQTPTSGPTSGPTKGGSKCPTCSAATCKKVLEDKGVGKPWGIAACENGKPCCCIWPEHMKNKGVNNPGNIRECVERHENIHVNRSKKAGGCKGRDGQPSANPDPPDHCFAGTEGAKCILEKLKEGKCKETKCRDDMCKLLAIMRGNCITCAGSYYDEYLRCLEAVTAAQEVLNCSEAGLQDEYLKPAEDPRRPR
jgi:RHS repeat-associated protein